MKIYFRVNSTVVEGYLMDTPSGRSFYSLLPLTLNFSGYANAEKVADLPAPLNRDGAPTGSGAKYGDITYYAPWGNLAIFYKDFSYADGLIKLGRLSGAFEELFENSNNLIEVLSEL